MPIPQEQLPPSDRMTTTPPTVAAPPPRFRPPPPKLPTVPAPPQAMQKQVSVKFSAPSSGSGHRVLIYGPGGIGKTTLCSALPGKTVFIDIEESLGKLGIQNVSVVPDVSDWKALRDSINASGWDGVSNIVIDSLTRAEEMAIAHTLKTVPVEKGTYPTSIEGYGYGKGFTHVYETFLPLLSDIDRHIRAGRNVVMICHDCTANVPNPSGDDWLRYEPRLQSPSSGKASVRLKVREWCDHVLFFGYDVAVSEDGKGRGSGTRTIYTSELPHYMAKSRSTSDAIPISSDEDVSLLWQKIIR